MKRIAIALIAASALTVGAFAQDDSSPKGIYRDPATTKTKNGIAYRILLAQGEDRHEVSVRHRFHSGDRFRLQINLKDSAYVYVLNRTFNGEPSEHDEKGITTVRDDDHNHRDRSSAAYTQLYPLPGERPQKISAGRYRDIPGDVLLRMDEKPGLEKLYVIVSDREIDLQQMFPGAIRGAHRAKGDSDDRDRRRADSEDDVLDRLNKELGEWAADAKTEGPAKGDEDMSQKGIERDTYTVAPRSKPFMAEITLHHYE